MRPRIRPLVGIIILVALSGCVQYEQAKIKSRNDADFAALKRTCEARIFAIDTSSLQASMPILDSTKATLAQLNDPSYPTPAQLPIISQLAAARQQCNDDGIPVISRDFGAAVGEAFQRADTTAAALYSQLYSGKLSFGEFNTARAASAREMKSSLLDIQAHQQERAAQNEVQLNAARIQAFGAIEAAHAATPAPIYQPVPAPSVIQQTTPRQSTTRCTQTFGAVNCTTSPY
ncbi:hypothetical protein [Paraburkholderia caballeronis]|uniref:hypothetical protein n=1 Tax=Paraburkholderia caballeronis TaxID=416943 RepID=UPI001065FA2D|nr:hypothetical protein [Paraburkholderia caballeronis]